MLGYVYSLSLRIMKMLRIVHWRWITTLLDEFWLLAILGYSTSQVLVVQQSKHLQRTHHHCRPVESPPACPPPMQSSRITSSVSTTTCEGTISTLVTGHWLYQRPMVLTTATPCDPTSTRWHRRWRWTQRFVRYFLFGGPFSWVFHTWSKCGLLSIIDFVFGSTCEWGL